MFFGWGNRRAASNASVARYAPLMVRELVRLAPRSVEDEPLQSRPAHPDKKAQMAGEKRDRERIPLEGQVRGEVMVFQPMTILDISLGGSQIETAFALQLDSLHDFRLSLGDRSVVVKGRVAYCHIVELTDVNAIYRTGVEFVALSEHARDAIVDFVAATRSSGVPPPVVDGTVDADGGD
jgi:hypothetical protein